MYLNEHLKTTFELTYKPLWNFLKWYGLFILIILISGPFLYEWRYGNDVGDLFVFYRNMIGFITLVFIPNLILLFAYFRENKETKFTTDYKKNVIEISRNGQIKTYQLAEINSSIYNRNTYSKDSMWQVFSYADLGYWDLTFKNGDRYYLTSYLIDINKKPLFENTEIKYSIFPSIDKTDPKIAIGKEKQQIEKRIEKLKLNLMQKSEFELKEIIKSKGKSRKK